MIDLICQTCNRPYRVHNYQVNSKYCSRECFGNREITDEHRKVLSLSHIGVQAGKNNGMWKGDNAGYVAIHLWIRRKKGKPVQCERCGVTERRLHWSNKDHLYSRDLDDWESLCASCHKKYEIESGLIKDYTGKNNPFYGKHHTEESKAKMRAALKARWSGRA